MSDRLLTPQQELFLAYYTNPKSETFGNAKQTALKVGYSLDYAENITGLMPDWLSDNIGLLKRLKKAEKVLDETLEMDTKDPVTNKTDSSLQKTKADVAKFIASTVGKSTYSTRTELTGQNGEALQIQVVNYDDTKKDTDTTQL